MSELEWTKNAAFQKAPNVSSVLANSYELWSPHYATDGLFQSGGISIFHSAKENSPWIKVDLLESLTVFFLRVFMRMDSAGRNACTWNKHLFFNQIISLFFILNIELSNCTTYCRENRVLLHVSVCIRIVFVDLYCDFLFPREYLIPEIRGLHQITKV